MGGAVLILELIPLELFHQLLFVTSSDTDDRRQLCRRRCYLHLDDRRRLGRRRCRLCIRRRGVVAVVTVAFFLRIAANVWHQNRLPAALL